MFQKNCRGEGAGYSPPSPPGSAISDCAALQLKTIDNATVHNFVAL